MGGKNCPCPERLQSITQQQGRVRPYYRARMKALFTSFHMLYCLSQNFKYFLRYGRMTIAVWELRVPGTVPPSVPSVDLRGAITQRPERQFTSGLMSVKDQEENFCTHQSARELSLWSLSYCSSKIDTGKQGGGDCPGTVPTLR